MSQLHREASSFRDPSGHILHSPTGVYRSLNRESYEFIQAFLQSPAYACLIKKDLFIPTELVDDATHTTLMDEERLPDRFYVQHKRLWFVNYPYEWTEKMLLDAARCTLDVQVTLMEYGYSLKDASSYNVQFNFGRLGPMPVFIDLGSIESLTDTGGVWRPYRQFVSHFILPLLYSRERGYDFKSIFLTDLDGFDPERAYDATESWRRFLPPYLTLVTLPHWLRLWETKRNWQSIGPKVASRETDTERTLFILRHIVRSLQRKIDRLSRQQRRSEWVDYEVSHSYPPKARAEKEAFVHRLFEQRKPETVLDIGCNVGQFSFIAAGYGAKVLALDTDQCSVDRLYQMTGDQHATVLPLCMDITNPSPGIGWNNRERSAFLDRVEGFDCVFALALVHHLLVAKGIPLTEIVDLFRRLTKRYLLIELVASSDPMFQNLLRGRDSLYAELSLDAQEQIFTKHFNILESHPLTGMARRLYLMEKR